MQNDAMKRNILRMAITGLVVLSSVAVLLLFSQREGYSDEPESFVLNSSQDCTQSKDATSEREVVELEETLGITDSVPFQSEMLSDAEIAAIPSEALEKIDKLTESQDDLVSEEIDVVDRIQDEVILENRAVDIQTMTPEGVVSCDATDNFIDSILEPEDTLIFVGGPLDNQ